MPCRHDALRAPLIDDALLRRYAYAIDMLPLPHTDGHAFASPLYLIAALRDAATPLPLR